MFLALIGLIPLLPLIGFVICGLFGTRLPRGAVTVIACGSVLLAFLVAAGAVLELRSLPPAEGDGIGSPSFEKTYWTWIPAMPFVEDAAGRATGRTTDLDPGAKGAPLAGGEPGNAEHRGAAEDAAAHFAPSSNGAGGPGSHSAVTNGHAPAPAGGSLQVGFGFRLDPLSAVMILVVTGVGFLIHVYSVGYMGHDPGYARYFSYLNLFTAMMLTLVLGNNFLLMFVGWEGVGLCSYLLIGFWYEDPEKAQAGRKAFITNRLGDFAFMLGMLSILFLFHTLDFSKVMAAVSAGGVSTGILTLIALLLFFGACGKSAQIPLFVWLPDAMAGPTPVSALIHAATMVTAGVYMVARCSVLFVHAPAALIVVAVVGAATALFAATIGLAQNDIKKVLAYSTVSQLGYMFLGLGVGAFSGAIFHLMTHAFFKALLFLGSGSVIHAMSGEQDIRKMGGLAGKLPWTYRTMFVGALAIAGIPILSGFFSKDEILWKAWEAGHWGLWAVGAVAAALTAFYMFRLIYMTFHGTFRGTHEQEHHLHESPPSMVVPLVILAVLSIVGGWIGIPHALGGFVGIPNAFGSWLEPVLARPLVEAGAGGSLAHAAAGLAAGSDEATLARVSYGATHGGGVDSAEYLLMGIAILIAVGGVLTARWFYKGGGDLPGRAARAAGPLYGLVANKYYVDELYDRTVLALFYRVSNLFNGFDRWVVDGLVNAAAAFTEMIGQILRLFQTGVVRNYALLVFIGAVLLIWALGR